MANDKWTFADPVKDGWYWVRSIDDKKGMKHHSVMIMGGWVHTIYGPESFRVKDVVIGELEWYGPIAPPE